MKEFREYRHEEFGQIGWSKETCKLCALI
jgi:hypothetical protein